MKRSISSHDFRFVVVVVIIVSKEDGIDFFPGLFTGMDPHRHAPRKKKKKAIGKYWERVINTVLELAQATIFGGERGVYNDNDRRRKSLMSYLRGKDFVLDFREKERE